jgi:hypothetical protein
MIYALLILILAGAVAFFHYTQGFFSATISALLAAIAAAVALSYNETLVQTLLQGKFSDTANAISLVVLFAVTYSVLRFVFDSVVPGNIRLPLILDKVGAAIMGVVAAIFTGGILAIAGQMLPFGPSIAGYERFETTPERSVVLPTSGQAQDLYVYNELKADSFEPNAEKGLIIPLDDIVVDFVAHLSEPSGALAGPRSLRSVHPAFLQELFADRLGIQAAAKRTAINVGARQQVTVSGVYEVDQLPQIEGEIKDLRSTQRTGTVKADAANALLVVRAMFDKDATDSDNLFRFSPATARLVANGKIYYPIGTVEHGNLMLAQKLDDPLIVDASANGGADLVYQVPRNEVIAGAAPGGAASTTPTQPKVADDVTLVVKRLARVDLSGKPVATRIPPAKEVAILRKEIIQKNLKPADAVVAAPLKLDKVQVSPQIFTKINVGTADATVKDQQLNSGTVSLQDKKFSKLALTPVDTIQKMRQGGYPVQDLYVPDGKVAVQLQARPEGENPWAFADDLGKFELVDANKGRYKPSGVLVQLKQPQGLDKLIAQYDAAGTVSSIGHDEGRPTDVWMVYLVPKGTQLQQWDFGGKKTADVNQTAE